MTWHITLIVLMAAFLTFYGWFIAAMLTRITRDLSRHKALRAELDDISRELDSYGPCPSWEQMEHINLRLDRYRVRFNAFKH